YIFVYLSERLKEILYPAPYFEAELTEDERDQLGLMVGFTHPVATTSTGIAEYLISAGIAKEELPSPVSRPSGDIVCEFPF
ncbi:hypothetical protein ACFL3I_12435, partial [Pseudomonadota bacterium]